MAENFYKKIVEESPLGYAYHKIICDDAGTPIDYVFVEINVAFEEFTGLRSKDVVGKRATEIFPNLKEGKFDWIKVYGDVALNGKKSEFEEYSEPLEQWYKLTIYSPSVGYFISIFQNTSDLNKKNEEIIKPY